VMPIVASVFRSPVSSTRQRLYTLASSGSPAFPERQRPLHAGVSCVASVFWVASVRGRQRPLHASVLSTPASPGSPASSGSLAFVVASAPRAPASSSCQHPLHASVRGRQRPLHASVTHTPASSRSPALPMRKRSHALAFLMPLRKDI
jgi:hypothetical protein